MAVSPSSARPRPILLLAASVVAVAVLARGARAQLSAGFYSASCPTVHGAVRQVMSQAVINDTRTGAAILRLFFHDCFVNGCDASLLLDDTATTPGEKSSGPNAGGSTFGFDVIDNIKTQVEAACPGTVSCADILALAARDSVNLVSPSLRSTPALPILPSSTCRYGGVTDTLVVRACVHSAGRAELGGAPGAARRDGPGPGRGEDAAGPGPGPRRAGLRLRRQGAHVARPGRALGRAHGRHGALRPVPHPRLLRRQREPGLRDAAAAALPGLRRRRQPRAAGPAHPQRVRQRLLPQPHVRRRAAALRPGALQQRPAGLPGAALQRQPRRLLGRLRRLHDQPRERQPAHRRQRGDQAGLQESQFLIYIHTSIHIGSSNMFY
ncbi:hypothetical protein ACQJBY_038047 [Aegilops geniculata]